MKKVKKVSPNLESSIHRPAAVPVA